MREKYLKMKDLNDHLLKQLETDQQEVDRLTMKKAELEDVSVSHPLCGAFIHALVMRYSLCLFKIYCDHQKFWSYHRSDTSLDVSL